MGLESASFISSLVSTNPIQTDLKRQGDDHLRLLKAVLQGTFPNAAKAFYFPTSEAKSSNFSVGADDMHNTFIVDTTGGEVTATLPALASGDAGWECSFIKSNTGTNALFIAPNSGTLQSGEVSGLVQCRRVIPGQRSTARWSGSAWFVSRVPSVPIGSIVDFCGATLPVGYEFPFGQTLTSASTKYPEFFAVNGSSAVAPDLRGRVSAGKDDMGGTSANRLTDQSGGLDGDTLLDVGGAETHTLTEAQLAAHDHSVTDPGHAHNEGDATEQNRTVVVTDGNPDTNYWKGANTPTATAVTGISVGNAGSDGAHNNVQPTIILNKLLVVE